MAERPKRDPDNVVPFRKPVKPREPLRLPKWLPPDLYRTVTGWIILTNTAIWLVMVFASRGQGIVTMFPSSTTFAFGSANTSVMLAEPWRLVSATFLHVGLGHLFANMFGLYIAGFPLERAFGPGRMAALYFAAAIAGSICSLAWHVLVGGGASVGASGAVLGVLGGLTAFYWRATGRHSPQTKTFLAYTAMGLVMGFVSSLFGGAIDNAAHAGGLAAGAAISWLLFAGSPAWQRMASRAAVALLFVLGLGSVGASLASSAMRGPDPLSKLEALVVDADTAFAAKDFATAEAKYAEAITIVPAVELRLNHALSLIALDRTEDGQAELEQLEIELREEASARTASAAVLLAHAKTLDALGRDDETLEALLRASTLDGDVETMTDVAEGLEARDRLAEARTAAKKARLRAPAFHSRSRDVFLRIDRKLKEKG